MSATLKVTNAGKLDLAAPNQASVDPRLGNAVPIELDWVAFCAQYFPGRRARHDFKAVVAYGAYKQDSHELLGRGAIEPPTGAVEAALDRAALQAWEGEGGAPQDEPIRTTLSAD